MLDHSMVYLVEVGGVIPLQTGLRGENHYIFYKHV